MTDLILSIPFALGALAGLAAGYLLACWRVSRATGQPLRRVIFGGPNQPEGPV